MSDLLDHAIRLHTAGYTPLPVRTDGSKAPAIPWQPYTDHQPDQTTVTTWFTQHNTDGIGVICGAASGHLEMLEVEARATGLVAQLRTAMADHDAADLWARIETGWVELSPAGGIHWHYRIGDGPAKSNTRLARDPDHQVLVETRGQGGFTVIAPSAGRTHPTGHAWTLATGSPHQVPIISSDERDLLHAVATTLDRTPAPGPTPDRGAPVLAGLATGTSRPGDDYNTAASWTDILGSRGWTSHRLGRGLGWRRPGKTTPGISATTGMADDADRLYVFTTSTELPTETPLSKFAAITLLEHGGDYTAAARSLGAAGYGSRRRAAEPVRALHTAMPPATPAGPAPASTTTTNGNLATVHELHPPAATTMVRSDDGNALALVETYANQIRYCVERGRWMTWTGNLWRTENNDGGLVREYAKRIARDLPDADQGAIGHKRRSLSARGTSDTLRQAATDERVTVTIDELDSHPWELNTPDGILDLRTGQLGPPDPAKLHTRRTYVAPDPTADQTPWLQFLDRTFHGDAELIGYMRRLVGYSAVGQVREHVLPFCYGAGGNGKGVFLEAIMGVLGDYSRSSPNGFLMASNYAAHSTEIARLAGARFVVCSEVNESDRFDEAKIKLLTGGDTLSARFMRQDDFEFTPSHHLWLMGNYQPAVEAGGKSIWRRLQLIPFTYDVPDKERIEALQDILKNAHGNAVMAWIAQGAAEYAVGGLQVPDSVKSATAEYAHDQDTVGRFLDEACHLAPSLESKAATVRAAYEGWCAENGETALRGRPFTTQLVRHGIRAGRNAPRSGHEGSRMYGGIALRSTDDDRTASRD